MSGTAAIVTALTEVTSAFLGVPLPVVLAAVAGASVARAYLPSLGFWKSSARVVGWVALGCFLTPLARLVVAKVLGNDIPTNALAGVAAILASAEGWPLMIGYLRREFPGLLERFGGRKGGPDA